MILAVKMCHILYAISWMSLILQEMCSWNTARSYESFPEIGSEEVASPGCDYPVIFCHRRWTYLCIYCPALRCQLFAALTGTAMTLSLSEDLSNLTELPSFPPFRHKHSLDVVVFAPEFQTTRYFDLSQNVQLCSLRSHT